MLGPGSGPGNDNLARTLYRRRPMERTLMRGVRGEGGTGDGSPWNQTSNAPQDRRAGTPRRKRPVGAWVGSRGRQPPERPSMQRTEPCRGDRATTQTHRTICRPYRARFLYGTGVQGSRPWLPTLTPVGSNARRPLAVKPPAAHSLQHARRGVKGPSWLLRALGRTRAPWSVPERFAGRPVCRPCPPRTPPGRASCRAGHP